MFVLLLSGLKACPSRFQMIDQVTFRLPTNNVFSAKDFVLAQFALLDVPTDKK